jgi:hypothetical protein
VPDGTSAARRSDSATKNVRDIGPARSRERKYQEHGNQGRQKKRTTRGHGQIRLADVTQVNVSELMQDDGTKGRRVGVEPGHECTAERKIVSAVAAEHERHARSQRVPHQPGERWPPDGRAEALHLRL